MLGKLTRNIGKARCEIEKRKKGPQLILVGKLGKFDDIRKVHQANKEIVCQIRKLEVRPKKKSSLNFHWEIRKIQPN